MNESLYKKSLVKATASIMKSLDSYSMTYRICQRNNKKNRSIFNEDDNNSKNDGDNGDDDGSL